MEMTGQHTAADPRRHTEAILWSFCSVLIIFSLLMATPGEIVRGLYRMVIHPDALITDYFVVGGVGATFFNSGLLMAVSLVLFRLCHISFSGPAIACSFLMAGFAMFGKNIANIWPIILGVYVASRWQREAFSKYIYIALYGTALAPLITEVALAFESRLAALLAALGVGVLIGVILVPLSAYGLRVHQGYNLYNVGFAAGLAGTLIVSVMKSFGYQQTNELVWTPQDDIRVVLFLYGVFFLMAVAGYWMGGTIPQFRRLYRHSGRLMADFVILDGVAVVLINMGTLGLFATTYLIAIGGNVNGATIGGIFTVVGFGALGKHLRNVIPILCGVILGSFVKVWDINDPNVQLAALFATGLAPISGQYGWPYGVLAGFLHSSLVLNTAVLHDGLNLYNNGFSAGLLALILVPIIESLKGRKENGNEKGLGQ